VSAPVDRVVEDKDNSIRWESAGLTAEHLTMQSFRQLDEIALKR
jgi:hypothetical protein